MPESTLPPTPTRSHRAGGRALLVVVMALTSTAALALLLNDIVRIAYLTRGGYTLELALGSPGGVPAELQGDNAATTSQFWTVLVSSSENLTTPTILQVVAIALTTLTFLAAAAVIVLLCARLWAGRTFATSTAIGMLALSALALVASLAAPWLCHRADAIALEQLDYATDGGERWVSLERFDLGSIDGSLLVLGIVVLLVALVYSGARRLQRDSDGLV
ncbi:MAG: hypothetical protein RJQ01_12630 [Microcella sp.]|uniref:hypothetical protein n=1 Tax=Microcella sp. TaxID=1913979 RepID=UPI003315E668